LTPDTVHTESASESGRQSVASQCRYAREPIGLQSPIMRAVVTCVVVAGAFLWPLTGATASDEGHTLVIEEGPPLLTRLIGTWTLAGTIAGKPTVHTVKAVWSLHDNYVRLEEKSLEPDSKGRPAYEATVFVGWNQHTHTYVCIWLDSTEVVNGVVSCEAQPTPNAIPFLFRDGQGKTIFSNTFTYHPATDQWDWALDEVDEATRTSFARVTLNRAH
jgi:hypothetical protein